MPTILTALWSMSRRLSAARSLSKGRAFASRIVNLCPYRSSRDCLCVGIKVQALDHVAHVSPVEHMRDIWNWYHHETPDVGAKSRLYSLANFVEWQRILLVAPVRITHGNAGLPDALDAFFNQGFVAVVKRLVSADKESSG